jgi:hypothetical protein
MAPDDDPKIEYSIKDILGEMKAQLNNIDEKLDTKANAAELRALEGKVVTLEGRVESLSIARQNDKADNTRRDEQLNKLEKQATAHEAVAKYKKWIVPIAVTAGTALIGDVIFLITRFVK